MIDSIRSSEEPLKVKKVLPSQGASEKGADDFDDVLQDHVDRIEDSLFQKEESQSQGVGEKADGNWEFRP